MKTIKNQKGQAVVEFAMIFPLLLILIMGIIQFGMLINAYLSIQNIAREGARAGSVGNTDIEVQNIMILASPTLNAENLSVMITPTEPNRISGETLTVKVSYNYFFTIPIIDKIFSNGVILNAETSMRIE